MGTSELNGFVEQGYLEPSVTEKYDPYYEPKWVGGSTWDDETAQCELEAYYESCNWYR